MAKIFIDLKRLYTDDIFGSSIKYYNYKRIALLILCMFLSGCFSFSDKIKTEVSRANIVVIVPHTSGEFSVEVPPMCVAGICTGTRLSPITSTYKVTEDVAARLQRVVGVQSHKFGKEGKILKLSFDKPVQNILVTLLGVNLIVHIKAVLSDDSGQIIDRSICMYSKRYTHRAYAAWDSDPSALEVELQLATDDCTKKFRSELGF